VEKISGNAWNGQRVRRPDRFSSLQKITISVALLLVCLQTAMRPHPLNPNSLSRSTAARAINHLCVPANARDAVADGKRCCNSAPCFGLFEGHAKV